MILRMIILLVRDKARNLDVTNISIKMHVIIIYAEETIAECFRITLIKI